MCRLPGPRVPLLGLLWPPSPPRAPARPARGPGAAGPVSVHLGQEARPAAGPGPRGCCCLTDVRPCFGLITTSLQSKNTLDLKAAIRQRWLFRKTAHQKPSITSQGSSTRVRTEGGHVLATLHCRHVAAACPLPGTGHAWLWRTRGRAPTFRGRALMRLLASTRCCAQRPRGDMSTSHPPQVLRHAQRVVGTPTHTRPLQGAPAGTWIQACPRAH